MSFRLPHVGLPVVFLSLPGLAAAQVTNPDFAAGLDGWTAVEHGGGTFVGEAFAQDEMAVLLGGDSFLVGIEQTFDVPPMARSLSFDVFPEPGWDGDEVFVPDAFEVRLLDAEGASAVPTWTPGSTAFFNWQPDGTAHEALGVRFDGITVTVDVSDLSTGQPVTLVFSLIGGNRTLTSGLTVDGIATVVGNRAPLVSAGEDATLECGTAEAELDGSETLDPDGDALSYRWTDAADAEVGTTAVVALARELGTETYTLTATDTFGAFGTDDVTIELVDTVAPVFSGVPPFVEVDVPGTCVGLVPDLRAVGAATDACDGPVVVAQSPPAGAVGTGPGTTVDVELRAEDAAGLEVTRTVEVRFVDADGSCGIVVDTDTDGDTDDTDVLVVDTDTDTDAGSDDSDTDVSADTDTDGDTDRAEDTDDEDPTDGGAGDDTDDDWDPQCGCATGAPVGAAWPAVLLLAAAARGRRRARAALVVVVLLLAGVTAGSARAADPAPTPIALDAVVNGSIPVGGGPVRYTFDAGPGDAVFVQALTSSAYFDTSWRVRDAWGRVLATGFDFYNLRRLRLMGGAYEVEVWNTAGTACTYAFVVSRSAALSLGTVDPGDVVDGTFTTAAEQHTYTLVLPTDDTIFLDGTANGATYFDTTWKLVDDLGTVVFDAPDFYDSGSLPLRAGSYTLTVAGVEATMGTYRFAVGTPVEDAGTLVLGTPASGALVGPGDVDRWTLTLAQAERVTVDVLATSEYFGTSWSLRDASGLSVVDAVDMYDVGPIALPAGTYTLVVDADGASTGTYQLRVDRVTDPTGVLAFGVPTEIVFDVVGEVGTYTFTATEGQQVVVSPVSITGGSVYDYTLTLRDPDGAVRIGPTSDAMTTAPHTLGAGLHTLVVDPRGSATGAITLRLDTAQSTTAAVVLDQVVTDAVTVPYGVRRYTFTAAAGTLVDLHTQATSNVGGLGWRLTDAAGRDVVAPTGDLFDRDGIALAGGAYALEVRSLRGEVGTFTVQVQSAGSSSWAPLGTSVSLDVPVSSTVPTPAGSQDWRIELASDTDVFFALDTAAAGLFWTLFDPAGRPVFGPADASNTYWHQQGPWSLAAGTYTLRVFATSGTPSYAFTVREVPPAVSQSVDVGEVAGDVFTTPGETHAWTFDVDVPTEVYLDLLTGGSRLWWRLIDPRGNVRMSARPAQNTYWDDVDPLLLEPGTWTLELDPESNETPAYSFAVRGTADQTVAGTVGAVLSASVTAPGSTVSWTFAVSSPQRVVFDLLSTAGGAGRWTLVDPSGNVRWDGLVLLNGYWDDRGPLWLTAGTWTLTLDPERDVQMDASFSLVPATSTSLSVSLDAEVNGAFTAAGQTHVHALTLDRTTRLYWDNRLGVGGLLARLVDPLGRVLYEAEVASAQQDWGAWTVPAGSYTLTLTQRGGGLSAYRFAFLSVEDVATTLAFGDTWALTPEIGADARGTFEVDTDGTLVQLDLIAGGFEAWLSVVDPVGTPVFGPSRMSDPSVDMEAVALARGTYTVLVDPIASDTTPFELDLRTGAADDPIFFYSRYSGVPNVKRATYGYDGAFSVNLVSSIASTSGADGLVVAPDGDLLIGGGALLHKVNVATGAVRSVGLGGGAAYHIALDPTGVKAWTSSMPGELVEVPLVPFGDGVLHHVEGDDGVVTHIAFDRTGRAFYTASPSTGFGSFGTIDLTTYRTTRALSNLPAAHGLAFDPFTDTLVLTGATHITQIDPNTLTVLSDLEVPGVQFDQGTVDGAGHAFVADNGGDLVFVDYSATGRVGDATNYVYHDFLDANLDDVAPMSWLGSACAGVPPIVDVSPAPGSAFAPGTVVAISGRVVPLDPTRPAAAVLVGGAPVEAIDAAGRFFTTRTVGAGAQSFLVEAFDRCGRSSYTLTLTGDVDATGSPTTLTEVSAMLDAVFSDTTFGSDANRLLVSVRAKNTSTDAVAGPVFLAVGSDLPADMKLENVEGVTPDGLPYVRVLDAGALAPGELTEARPLSFLTPTRRRVLFTPRFFTTGNHPPVFASVPVTSARVGRPWRHTARAVDPDKHSLTYTLELGPPGASFDPATGALSWTPDADDVGLYDVAVSVRDGFGGTARQAFTLDVSPLDASVPPLFVSIPVTQVSVGAAYRYDADAVDPDGDPLAYAVVSGPAGLVVDGGTGVVSWPFAAPGDHDVVLRVTDGRGGEATQGFTLSAGVVSRNPSGPQITSAPPTVVPLAGLYLYQPIAFDPDGDTLSWTLDEGPDGMTVTPSTGRLLWTPVQAQLGEHTLVLTVSDGRGGTATQRWRVAVFDGVPNRAPVFTSVPGATAVVGVPFRYAAVALDPELGPVSYARATGPEAVLVGPTGELTWTPTSADVGVVPVGVRASDLLGASSTQVFLVEVRATNAPPQLVGTPPTAAFVGERWSYDLGAIDADGDRVSFAVTEGPAGLTVDATTGLVSWIPGVGDLGAHPVTITAEDPVGGLDLIEFVLTVSADVTPPVVFVSAAPAPVCAGEGTLVCVGASDEVSIASRTLLVDAAITALDTRGCASVSPDEVGALALRATATDRAGNLGEDELVVQVVDCDDGETPLVQFGSPASMVAVTEPVDVVGTIDDNQPATLSWRVEVSPHGEDVWTELGAGSGPVDGALATFDPTLLPTGDYDLRIYASDGPNWHVEQITVAVDGQLKLGNFGVSFTDLTFDLRGIPLSILRAYDTLEVGTDGDFGPGWRLGLSGFVVDTPLELAADVDPFVASLSTPTFQTGDRVTVMRPDGRRVAFRFEPELIGNLLPLGAYPHFEPEPGVTDTLVAEGASIVMNFGTGWRNYILSYNPSRYVLTTTEGVKYTYDELLGLVRVEDVYGNTVDVREDGLFHSSGAAVAFARDGAGRITSITGPDTLADGTVVTPVVLRYAYDADGNLTRVEDVSGAPTTFSYVGGDHPHHLDEVRDPLGRPVVRTVYDADGRLAAQCGPEGDVETLDGCVRFEHTPADRVSTTFDARGARIDEVFDPRGNVVVERRWLDGVTSVDTTTTYDEEDRIIALASDGSEWTYIYDERGRMTSAVDPDGRTSRWTYGVCMGPLSASNPRGDTRQWTYDEFCGPATATDATGGVTTFTADLYGDVSRIERPDGAVWRFAYDDWGRTTEVTAPSGQVTRYAYGEGGAIIAATEAPDGVVSREYDAALRLVREVWPSAAETTYDYDLAGKLERVEDDDTLVELTWDVVGRVRTLTTTVEGTAPITLTYTHDGSGNVVSVADSLGGVTATTWDNLSRPVQLVLSGASVAPARVDLTYDDLSRLTSVTRWRDAAATLRVGATTLSYDGGAILRSLAGMEHRNAADVVVGGIGIARDPFGIVTGIDDAEGEHAYVVDGESRLLSADHPAGVSPDEVYTWDSGGRRTTSHLSTTHTYGTAPGTSPEWLVGDDTYTYRYDAAGRLVERTHRTAGTRTAWTWDPRGQLTSHTDLSAGGAALRVVRYVYDGLGRRVAVRRGVQTVVTVLDRGNPVVEVDDAGTVLVRRLYGPLLDQVFAESSAGTRRWALTDTVGSVRDWTDDTGAPVQHLVYDSFGRILSGASPTTYAMLAYGGRPTDVDTGLVDLRARTYDPRTGRFLSPDPKAPFGYEFAGSSPLSLVDPTGESVAIEYACLASEAVRNGYNFGSTIGKATYDLLSGVAVAVITLRPPPGNLVNGMLSGISSYLGDLTGMPEDTQDVGKKLNELRSKLKCVDNGAAGAAARAQGAANNPPVGLYPWTGPSWTKY